MIIGLTGGIGSGKSTVAEIFKHLGVPIFIADLESKHILETDRALQAKLAEILGWELLKNGQVDKLYMAQKIFTDQSLLQAVNALLHPLVGKAFDRWALLNEQSAYVIREAAILFESNSYQDCEKIIVVTAPRALRIKRVMVRSNLTAEAVEARMAKQWPQEKKDSLADFLVDNSGKQSLIKQVLTIHENIIRTAK
jgi:dephospho-CoA kinase